MDPVWDGVHRVVGFKMQEAELIAEVGVWLLQAAVGDGGQALGALF